MNTLRKGPLWIIFGALTVLAALFYFFLVSPALSRQERLAGLIRDRKTDLLHMRELQAEWQRFQDARTEAEKLISRRGKNFSPLSYMEGLTRKIGVSDKIAYMKPLSYSGDEEGPQKRTGIEIRLEGLQMKELVRLLQETEYSKKLLTIDRIKIDALSKGKIRNLKVTLQVRTFTPSS
jgi:hypothetical protein